MKNLKKEKGITLLTLCIIIVILIVLLVIVFGGSGKDNGGTTSSSYFTKENRATYVSKCKTIDYTSLARNPNQYKGQNFVFTGEVIQVMEDNNDLALRVNVTQKRYEYLDKIYYEDTILVAYKYSSSAESRILEGDVITLYGQSMGTYTYKSVMGASVTVPSIKAMYIDIKQ